MNLSGITEDWAFFRMLGDETLSIGIGPFQASESPPADGVAFYVNDFGLGDPQPWKIPSRFIRVDRIEAGDYTNSLDWKEPLPEPFAAVFGEVSEALRLGHLEKSVPVVTERAALAAGDRSVLAAYLARRASHFPPPYYSYGWSHKSGGFAGATPELLMSMKKGRLKTMALAGTARRTEVALFAVDEKEIREHEFVAATMVAKFSDVGMVRREARRIMELEHLIHFHTPIAVELYRNEDPATLVSLLHPTPALGSLPRSQETMAQLISWRKRLRCPPYFGAPFGFWDKGVFTCIVTIRGLHWDAQDVMVPSGCGVIGESRLLNEWRELALKRGAVKAAFGLMS